MSNSASDDDAPEEVAFALAPDAEAAVPLRQPTRKRARGLERLRIAPVPVSSEMLELLSQQQREQAAPPEPHDAHEETEEERRRRLRRQKRAKLAQQASREQSRSLMRQEVRCETVPETPSVASAASTPSSLAHPSPHASAGTASASTLSWCRTLADVWT